MGFVNGVGESGRGGLITGGGCEAAGRAGLVLKCEVSVEKSKSLLATFQYYFYYPEIF